LDLRNGERYCRTLVWGPEGLMPRPRAADDFKTIRTRMEELWRERLPEQPAPTTDTSVAGHRGRCGCDMRILPRRIRRIVQSALTGSEPKGMRHQLPVAASAPALPVLSGRDQVVTAMRCSRARLPKSQPHFSFYYVYHNMYDFVNNCFAVTQRQSVPEGALPTKNPKSKTFLAASNSAQKSRWDIECDAGAPARDPHLRTYL
jgi:hypothetical protein